MSRTSTWSDPTDHGSHRPYGRDTRQVMAQRLTNLADFEGHSMWAVWATVPVYDSVSLPDRPRKPSTFRKVYRVYSYETVIAEWWPTLDGGTYHVNETVYGQKTQEHKNFVALHLWHYGVSWKDPHVVEWHDVAGDTHGLSGGKW